MGASGPRTVETVYSLTRLSVQVPGKNLFPINEALEKGTIIMNLLSDAAQSQTWKDIKPYLVRPPLEVLQRESVS